MESAGVVATLAEPNLTAISGESATFIRAANFPFRPACPANVATGVIGNCLTTVVYKKFGIALNFTPVVLTEGRISLRVMTEVSEVSTENALTGGIGGTTIPSIKDPSRGNHAGNPIRRLDSDGGLIQEQTKQAVNGCPASTSCRFLERFFRRVRILSATRTEADGHRDALCRSGGWPKKSCRDPMTVCSASDSQSTLLARINQIYGVPGSADRLEATRAILALSPD